MFVARLGSSSAPTQLYVADAAGATRSLGFDNRFFHSLAPTGDGRIYMHSFASGEIEYLDAADMLHTVMDESGTQPFDFAANTTRQFHYRAMVYHEQTNSLFAAAEPWSSACSGSGIAVGVAVRRATLSADGSRVVGPIGCVEFDVSPGTAEVPIGFDVMPDGDLLLTVDTNSNAEEPRMVRVDPYTMNATPFARSSFQFVAAATAGCWSTALGRAVVLDTSADVLRSYADGESGSGTVIATTSSISATGSSGERSTLIEIPVPTCSGQLSPFGSGTAGLGGFVPTLTATGCAQAGGTVTLHAAWVRGGAAGALLIGDMRASLPLLGGTLWVLPIAGVPIAVGGAVDDPGAGTFALPVTIGAAGTSYVLQGLFVDLAAPAGVSMTGGLELVSG